MRTPSAKTHIALGQTFLITSLLLAAVYPIFLGLLLVVGAIPSAQLVPRGGEPPIAVRSHRVEAVVEDGLARTRVRQTFVNPHLRS